MSPGGHQQTVLGKGLWEDRDSEVCHLAQGGLPRNAFEEQIEWTKQGKMWTFPIDNEAGKVYKSIYDYQLNDAKKT